MNNIEIMGVLNITENSFYDGGKFNDLKKSIKHASNMISDGADIIDIGAESSKPGSEPVSASSQIKKIEHISMWINNFVVGFVIKWYVGSSCSTLLGIFRGVSTSTVTTRASAGVVIKPPCT